MQPTASSSFAWPPNETATVAALLLEAGDAAVEVERAARLVQRVRARPRSACTGRVFDDDDEREHGILRGGRAEVLEREPRGRGHVHVGGEPRLRVRRRPARSTTADRPRRPRRRWRRPGRRRSPATARAGGRRTREPGDGRRRPDRGDGLPFLRAIRRPAARRRSRRIASTRRVVPHAVRLAGAARRRRRGRGRAPSASRVDAVAGAAAEAARLRDLSTYSGFVIAEPDVDDRVAEADVGDDRPDREDRVERGERGVAPVVRVDVAPQGEERERRRSASGATTYSSGEAVRFFTFGVRANGIFLPVSACWIDLSTPARLTGSRMRLKP